MQNKFIALFLCTCLITTLFFNVSNIEAATVTDPGNTAVSTISSVLDGISTIATTGDFSTGLGWMALGVGASNMITAAKILALLTVQKSIQTMIGEGDGMIIRDYNEYLFINPKQIAMANMNSFFNTVSKGRLSTLNYEGIGPNHDSYLVAQARKDFIGQTFQTNLQEQVTDPTKLFSTGNMKGIMTYMQCANNPACYTLTSSAKYKAELVRAQEIAKAESANTGFRPQKKDGRIVKPSSIAQSALAQIDQLGTQIIMNAEPNEGAADLGVAAAMSQIAQGTAISIGARALNYGISDSKGRAAIRNQNDEFPFSLNYSFNSGVGFSAGGVSVSTGAGAIDLQDMIGNTCATASMSIDPVHGAVVSIQGKKYSCETKREVSGTLPSITDISAGSVTCSTTDDCNSFCSKVPGCQDQFGTLFCHPVQKKCMPVSQ